ncbi:MULTISPECIES: hypothetical protein [unclassified Rathayibacter]|uniref:hypothetical protein n=1 Tax=unclassified Rathayibacter TaxID=2609250 RepID=UPI0006FD7540|nr:MULTISPECIES: hypothetical protein [unclassified Rathayibacter]KQQ05055.1 hypothetical protein ASF42_00025 [Rathayibacter sp. Leaf294]KQS12919.1 hypothetical protein ASG06_00025 [Rathayibacter sp. Leaf185]
MPLSSPTGALELAPPALPVAPDTAPMLESEHLVRPADLVSALTGVALCFFSLFVFAIAHWQYFGPDVDEVSVLGWLAPLIAGAVCLVASAIAVGLRVAARSAERSGAQS